MNGKREPIAKAMRLLRWAIETNAESFGVREVARQLAMPSSGAHRLLTSLVAEGMLVQIEQAGRYALSVDVYRLAAIMTANVPIFRLAGPAVRKLRDVCGETVNFVQYDQRRQMMFAAISMPSDHALRVVHSLRWRSVRAGAMGLSILAFLPDADRREIIERRPLEPETENTIVDAAQLEKELGLIRKRGYAHTRGQRVPGVVGLGAPVFGANGVVFGSVCIIMPEQRFDPAREPELVKTLLACAAAITQTLATEGGGKTRLAAGKKRI